jgi:HSP20 family protein
MTVYPFPMTASVSPAGVRREMDRLVQEVFGNSNGLQRAGWTPPTDAIEDSTGFTLEMEIPGIAPESVELLAEDGVLIARGEKSQGSLCQDAPEGTRMLFAERAGGSFERRFRLPKSADLGSIEARYRHGVLTVRVAKHAPAQPRRVEIKIDQGPVSTQKSLSE